MGEVEERMAHAWQWKPDQELKPGEAVDPSRELIPDVELN